MNATLRPLRLTERPSVSKRTARRKPLTAVQIERMLRADGFKPTDQVMKRSLAAAGHLGMPAE